MSTSLVFKVEEPVPFNWTYRLTADNVELDSGEPRRKIIDHLASIDSATLLLIWAHRVETSIPPIPLFSFAVRASQPI